MSLVFGSQGCRLFGKRDTDQVATRLSEPELHDLLGHWVIDLAGRMEDISTRLEEAPTVDRAERRRIIEWKLRWIPTLHRTAIESDARRALLDLWGLALLIKKSFGTEQWRKERGAIAEDALAAMVQSVADLEAIAARLLPPDRLDAARKAVNDFADKNVVAPADLLSDPPSFSRSLMASGGGAVSSVLAIPLSPFGAFEGVNEGAAAIRDFTSVADRFSNYVEALPTYVFWHLQLLLDDLDRTPSLVSVTESMNRLSTSAEGAVETTRALPAAMGKEIETALDSVIEKQAELRTTIDEVRNAVTELRQTIDAASETTREVKGVVDSASELSTSLERVATAATAAGTAWESTLATYERIASAPAESEREKPAGEPEEPGPTILDYGNSAEKIGKAAIELRQTLEELQALTSGDELPSSLAKIAETADRSVDHARNATGELADRIFYRGLILVAVVLLGILGLRFVPRRS
jgi:hypothetical protein